MVKRVLAIAVASVFGAPVVAHAQTSTVQVFGRLYTELSYINTGTYNNGTHANPDILQTPGSEIGFKGEEPLGGGLSAWFQCASTADTRAESTGGFCSRDSAVGLRGAFGNVWFGNWDTPYKRVFAVNRILNTTGAFGVSVLLTGGSTTTRGQLVRPYPQFTGVTDTNRSIGTSRCDSMCGSARKTRSASAASRSGWISWKTRSLSPRRCG